ncbi:MAG: response regulator [Candidatus Nitrosopolaris sp.]|jgi:CheY-like chemotaxis protein
MFNNQPRQRNPPPRIMVVDDEKDILRIIKRDLESNDSKITFRVDAFSDSESALNAFNSHPNDYYDLVLTDIRMPKMNGFELYRHIKQRNPTMKIAFITAFEITKEEFSKVLPSIDVEHFIKKPVTMSNLRPKLKSIIEN